MVYNVLSSFCDLQKIMGRNFVNPLDWHRSLKMPLSEEQRLNFLKFPWSLSLLESSCPFQSNKKISETHILFWGFPQFSILSFAEKHSAIHLPNYGVIKDLSEISALRETLSPRWHLMPLHGQVIVSDKALSFAEHVALIPSHYVLSLAVEELFKQYMFFKVNDKYPADGVLYDYQLEKKVFNQAYKIDRNQPKFVDKLVDFSGPRQLFLRCADEWSSEASASVTNWDAKNGLRVLPFPYQASYVFPLALSLSRDYPR